MTDNSSDNKFFNMNWKQLTLALCIASVVFVCVWHINVVLGVLKAFAGFFSTVIIGIVIAYVLNPLVAWIQNHIFKKMKSRAIARNLSVLVALLIVIAFVAILLVALIPQLVKSITAFAGNFGTYVDSLRTLVDSAAAEGTQGAFGEIDFEGLVAAGNTALSAITDYLSSNSGAIIERSINIGAGVVNFIVAVFIAVYLLVDTERILRGVDKFFRVVFADRDYENFSGFWSRCNSIMGRYIVYDVIDGIFVGVVNFIFMCIAGYPYGVLVSVVVGVTNLAPTFGPIVGGAIGAFILLLVNPWFALGFLIFTFALQTFDGYIFKPKMFGNTLGVPPVMILISIVVFGRMFGVLGILIAIPLAAILDYAYDDWLMPKLKERKEKMEENASSTDSSEDPSDSGSS